ncbi:MAG: hypothetical protein ACUVTM_01630 [Candidatus Bathyarchaeia archaeon]
MSDLYKARTVEVCHLRFSRFAPITLITLGIAMSIIGLVYAQDEIARLKTLAERNFKRVVDIVMKEIVEGVGKVDRETS